MAFTRHGSFNTSIVIPPPPPPPIKHYKGSTKKFKSEELKKLLQNHLIICEFWKEGFKWVKKDDIVHMQYRLSYGEMPKNKGDFILILYKIDGVI